MLVYITDLIFLHNVDVGQCRPEMRCLYLAGSYPGIQLFDSVILSILFLLFIQWYPGLYFRMITSDYMQIDVP